MCWSITFVILAYLNLPHFTVFEKNGCNRRTLKRTIDLIKVIFDFYVQQPKNTLIKYSSKKQKSSQIQHCIKTCRFSIICGQIKMVLKSPEFRISLNFIASCLKIWISHFDYQHGLTIFQNISSDSDTTLRDAKFI